MRNEWTALLLSTALVAGPAHAGSTADDLAQIEAEHLILKARLRTLETRAQMAARQADIQRFSTVAKETAMPTVAGIDGIGDTLHATVLLENGNMAEVKAGDTLPNGMRVISIRQDGVVVMGPGKKRVRLKPGVEPDPRGPAFRMATDEAPVSADRVAVLPPMPSLPARPGTPR